MNQNYPEYIMRMLRSWEGLAEDNTSYDSIVQEQSPYMVFAKVLEHEGIIGYHDSILAWIADIFKVKLNPYAETQSRQDYVEGLTNISRAHRELVNALAVGEITEQQFQDARHVVFNIIEEDVVLFVQGMENDIKNVKSVAYSTFDSKYDGEYVVLMKDGSTKNYGWYDADRVATLYPV